MPLPLAEASMTNSIIRLNSDLLGPRSWYGLCHLLTSLVTIATCMEVWGAEDRCGLAEFEPTKEL
jgi:hypothetical protein